MESHFVLIITEPSKIADNIYLLDNVWSSYLVTGTELALVEPGVSTNVAVYIKNIKRFGFNPEDISYIIVPHAHSDHRSGFASLLEYMPNVKIVAHSLGVETLKHPEIPPPLREFSRGWKTKPVEVSKTVKEGDLLDLRGVKLRVIETPGHSNDSISLYDEKSQSLFVSDATGAYMPWNNNWVPNPFYDLKKYYDSLEKLAKLPLKTLIPAHNGVTTGSDAKSAMGNALKTAREWEKEIFDEIRKGPVSPDQIALTMIGRYNKEFDRAKSEYRAIGMIYPFRYIINRSVSSYCRELQLRKRIEIVYPDLPYFRATSL